ncbi:MAG TPA: hypothetical protein VMB80_16630 [Candidatus Acidoferrum sp.]|nr:hypothetical protein [Candidatus Acidoferrum sp.]
MTGISSHRLVCLYGSNPDTRKQKSRFRVFPANGEERGDTPFAAEAKPKAGRWVTR